MPPDNSSLEQRLADMQKDVYSRLGRAEQYIAVLQSDMTRIDPKETIQFQARTVDAIAALQKELLERDLARQKKDAERERRLVRRVNWTLAFFGLAISLFQLWLKLGQ